MMPSWGHFLLQLMTIGKKKIFGIRIWTSPCQNLSEQISATRVVFNWRKKLKHMWIYLPTASGEYPLTKSPEGWIRREKDFWTEYEYLSARP